MYVYNIYTGMYVCMYVCVNAVCVYACGYIWYLVHGRGPGVDNVLSVRACMHAYVCVCMTE